MWRDRGASARNQGAAWLPALTVHAHTRVSLASRTLRQPRLPPLPATGAGPSAIAGTRGGALSRLCCSPHARSCPPPEPHPRERRGRNLGRGLAGRGRVAEPVLNNLEDSDPLPLTPRGRRKEGASRCTLGRAPGGLQGVWELGVCTQLVLGRTTLIQKGF